MDSRPSSHPSADSDLEQGFTPRRTSRVVVDEAARLNRSTTYQVEVKVRNLSSCGFMAECSEAVGIGSYVMLDVPGVGPIEAQVRWQIGSRMGGMFNHPISLARCEWAAERADQAKPA
jgi:hypothetical protein